MHGLLEHERGAIVTLFEAWGEIDRSHRTLAHRIAAGTGARQRVLGAPGMTAVGPGREPLNSPTGRLDCHAGDVLAAT